MWPQVAPRLESAFARAPDNADTILDVYIHLTRNPEYQLWVSDTAAIVTRTARQPSGLTMHFWLAAGDLAGVEALVTLAESLARTLGCHHLTMFGRLGWQRSFLSRSGWDVEQVGMRKRL